MAKEELFIGLFEAKPDDSAVPACPLPSGKLPQSTPIAMAYVPYQFWEKPYDDETALCRGTVFPSLDKPFIGEEAVKNADAQ